MLLTVFGPLVWKERIITFIKVIIFVLVVIFGFAVFGAFESCIAQAVWEARIGNY